MLLNDFSLNFQVRPTLFLNISRFKSDIQKVVPILIREVIRPFEMEENFLAGGSLRRSFIMYDRVCSECLEKSAAAATFA